MERITHETNSEQDASSDSERASVIPTRVEQAMARGALSDSIWKGVTDQILAEAAVARQNPSGKLRNPL